MNTRLGKSSSDLATDTSDGVGTPSPSLFCKTIFYTKKSTSLD